MKLIHIIRPLAYWFAVIIWLINTSITQAQTYTFFKATYTAEEPNIPLTTKQLAQQNITLFLNAYQQNHTQKKYTFSALVHFKEDTVEEHTWIVLKEVTADEFRGYLSDVYDNSLDLSSEQVFSFKQNQIEDWRIDDSQLNTTTGAFGLQADLTKSFQKRESIELNSSAIPASLHGLIPQAIKWGISDDFLRLEQQRRATLEEKKQLLKMVEEKEGSIDDWLAEYANNGSYSTEKSSFYYLMVSVREIKSSIN